MFTMSVRVSCSFQACRGELVNMFDISMTVEDPCNRSLFHPPSNRHVG